MVPRVVVTMVVVVMAWAVRSQRPFSDHFRPWEGDSRPPLGHSDAHFIHQEGPRSSFSLRTLSPHKDSHPPPRALHPSGPPSGHPGPLSFSGIKEEDIFRPRPRPRPPRPPPSRHKHHHSNTPPRKPLHHSPPPPHKPHHSLPPPHKPHHSAPSPHKADHSPPLPHKPHQSPPSPHKPHHSPPQHEPPHHSSPPQKSHHSFPPHKPPHQSPPHHSEPPHHSSPPQPPHRKSQGAVFTTTVHEHKNEGPGGCQTKEGFYFAGQTWFVKGCRRRKCIHFRGKFFTETDSCDSEIFNTTYRCVIQVDTTADFPRCCPTYKCNPDNLGNSV